MTKERRHGDEIVAALVRLGCVVYDEDEESYWVARANVRRQMIRKWFLLPSQEQRIVERLDHSMNDYMSALRANREALEVAKQEATRLVPSKVDSDEIQKS